ncbi:MAG: ABC transporter permease [Candidatus Marinimicrobia bacterium]|nr:ABC transporter permease [Candidatus Neomarinimicrobiota bacterium]
MISKFAFLIGEGIKSLWRDKLPALGSVFTIALTLIIFGTAYLIFSNFDRATRRLQSQYRIDAFYDPLLSKQEAYENYKQLKEIEGVASTEFVSKEQAARIFREEFGEDVVDVLGTNPLPAGAIVLVARGYRTARRINAIADQMLAIPRTTDVTYRGELVRILERYLQMALLVGLVIGVVTLMGTIFLVSNTIKLSIYAKRESIDTLYLLGATRQFIRLPFLIDGTLQGLFGAMLAAMTILGILDVMNYILEQFVLYRIIRPPFLTTGLLLFGMLLGLVGSFRSIRKFLSPRELGIR